MTAVLGLLRRVWWLVPIVALAAGWWWTSLVLADVRLTLAGERLVRVQDAADAAQAKAVAELAIANRLIAASDAYAARLASIDPIILESTKTVREYAETDAGRTVCRDADRVRAIDELNADLASDTGAASSRSGVLRADASASTGGR